MTPGVGRQAGLHAGLAQELLAVPAPLGRDLRQQQPAATALLDDQAVHADGDGLGPRRRSARAGRAPRSRATARAVPRGAPAGSADPRLAESAAQRTTSAARPSRFCSVPRQPRSCPCRLMVTNTPDASGQSTATAAAVLARIARLCPSIDARASARSVCALLRGQQPSPGLVSAGKSRTPPRDSRPRRCSRRRFHPSARTSGRGRRSRPAPRRQHHRDRRPAAARDVASALALRILLEQLEQSFGIEAPRRATATRRSSFAAVAASK